MKRISRRGDNHNHGSKAQAPGSGAVSSSSSSKNHGINLYQQIPTVEVGIDDFEEFGLERLKVRMFLFGFSFLPFFIYTTKP